MLGIFGDAIAATTAKITLDRRCDRLLGVADEAARRCAIVRGACAEMPSPKALELN